MTPPPDHTTVENERGCGQRLREAREAAGLSLTDVAGRLKVPTHIAEALEAEDWARIGAPVFVRGHVRSYARLLGLPEASLQSAAHVAPIAPPQLVPRIQTPLMQRFTDRVGRPLVYIVITALMVVLPVWMATQSRLDRLPEAASLDAPANKSGPAPGSTKPAAPVASEPSTVVASMASLSQRREETAPTLSLRLQDDSWVQVVAPDGSSIEEALLPAGTERSWPAADIGRVVLGNAAAVEVRSGDRVEDLAPYMRANVARFTVSSDGSLAPSRD